MGISRCKLKRKEQIKLLEFFVGEVRASSVADMWGLQANTVALFYRKVRQVIVDVAPEQGEFEADQSFFGGVRKGG